MIQIGTSWSQTIQEFTMFFSILYVLGAVYKLHNARRGVEGLPWCTAKAKGTGHRGIMEGGENNLKWYSMIYESPPHSFISKHRYQRFFLLLSIIFWPYLISLI